MKQLAAFLLAFVAFSSSHAFQVSLQIWDAPCTGQGGGIIATPLGGVAPFTYDWGAGLTGPQVTDLVPGSYTVTVTDGLGAVATATGTVHQASTPYSNITILDYLGLGGLEACWNGPCDGGFRVHLPRVIGGYSFITTPSMSHIELPEDEPTGLDEWMTFEFVGACPGPVQLTISNSCGSGNSSIVIEQLPVPVVNVLELTGSCNGADDGSLHAEVVLDAPASMWNPWSLVALDAPVGGNAVVPNPASFNFGTTPFQLLGLHPGTWVLYFTTLENDGSAQAPCAYGMPFTIPDLGTDCATVSGTLHFETDMDCAQNGLDVGIPNQMLRVTPGPLYGITGPDGSYEIAVPFGSYTLEQLNPDAVQLCPPAAPIPFTVSSGTNATVDIADSLLSSLDLRAHLWSGTSRVGMPFSYYLDVSNLTAHPAENVVITLDYDALFSFISAAPAYSSSTPGQVVWELPIVQPFEHIHLNVQVQVPPNPALLGTVHTATLSTTSTSFEAVTTNNTDGIQRVIVGSYDPNDKQAFTSSGQNETTYLLDVDEHIEYLIRFQNTGTDTAFNITVTDTISALLDMASLQVLGASHAFTPHIATGNVIEFHFADILLPDSNVNEMASHGYVAFSLKPVANITIGSTIPNAADIYFDFNDPVRTNTASLDVGVTTGLEGRNHTGLVLSPVPATDRLSIRSNGDPIVASMVRALDGRVVIRSGHATTIDVSGLSTGVYVVEVITATGEAMRSSFVKR
jgi:uncharacterized repeat protein (TIGR01451 family)